MASRNVYFTASASPTDVGFFNVLPLIANVASNTLTGVSQEEEVPVQEVSIDTSLHSPTPVTKESTSIADALSSSAKVLASIAECLTFSTNTRTHSATTSPDTPADLPSPADVPETSAELCEIPVNTKLETSPSSKEIPASSTEALLPSSEAPAPSLDASALLADSIPPVNEGTKFANKPWPPPFAGEDVVDDDDVVQESSAPSKDPLLGLERNDMAIGLLERLVTIYLAVSDDVARTGQLRQLKRSRHRATLSGTNGAATKEESLAPYFVEFARLLKFPKSGRKKIETWIKSDMEALKLMESELSKNMKEDIAGHVLRCAARLEQLSGIADREVQSWTNMILSLSRSPGVASVADDMVDDRVNLKLKSVLEHFLSEKDTIADFLQKRVENIWKKPSTASAPSSERT